MPTLFKKKADWAGFKQIRASKVGPRIQLLRLLYTLQALIASLILPDINLPVGHTNQHSRRYAEVTGRGDQSRRLGRLLGLIPYRLF